MIGKKTVRNKARNISSLVFILIFSYKFVNGKFSVISAKVCGVQNSEKENVNGLIRVGDVERDNVACDWFVIAESSVV